jgi:hypothetical protein
MKHLVLFSILFIWSGAMAQENKNHLLFNAGNYQILERDFGYSPLRFTASSSAFSLGFAKSTDKKTDEFYFHFSSHTLKNRFDAELKGIHASILTYTFYPASWLPERMEIGWSNNNELSTRDFADAQNFSPRFDFHTSFGAALRYQFSFGKEERFRFCTQGHWQLIGFVFQSSFVTSPPDPFLHGENSFQSFLQSIRFFNPLKQHNFGVLNQLFYGLQNGNEVGIGYRFNYTSLQIAHRAQRATGHYFVQLNYKI